MHCENWEIARIFDERLRAEGRTDWATWSDRSPHFLEATHIRTYGDMAAELGCPIYIQHATTPESYREILELRGRGVTVHAQTGPHWLHFGKEEFNAWRINVPLRSRENNPNIWRALREGVINSVGSDHVVSWPPSDYDTSFNENIWELKTGFTSRVEMLLPVMLEGVHQGKLSLERIVEVACENPAKIFGLYPRKGSLEVGADADIVLADLDKRGEGLQRHGAHPLGLDRSRRPRRCTAGPWRRSCAASRCRAGRTGPPGRSSSATPTAATCGACPGKIGRRQARGGGRLMAIWDDVLPEEDRLVFERAGWGKEAGFGERPVLLVVDVIYNFVGDKPEPILDSIERWRYSCGERGWEGIAHLRRLIEAAREREVPIFYTGMDRRPDGFDQGCLELEEPSRRRGLGREGLARQRDRRRDRARARGRLLREGQAERLPRHPPARPPDLSRRGHGDHHRHDHQRLRARERGGRRAVQLPLDRPRRVRLGPVGDLTHKVNLLDIQMKYGDVKSIDDVIAYYRGPAPAPVRADARRRGRSNAYEPIPTRGAGVSLEIRKLLTFVEEVRTEGGRGDGDPLVKAATAVVFRNPYAGARYSEDLSEIEGPSAELGALIGERCTAAVGGTVESHGKAVLVGTAGEQEHGNAAKTTTFGNPFREAFGGGRAWLPSTTKRCAPGAPGRRPALLQGRDLGPLALRHDHGRDRRRSGARTRSC